jgi:hypothetical protein
VGFHPRRPILLSCNSYIVPLAKPVTLIAPDIMLMQYLSELLAFFVAQHGHRAQFFILSNPVSIRIATLLYMKQKPSRHGKHSVSGSQALVLIGSTYSIPSLLQILFKGRKSLHSSPSYQIRAYAAHARAARIRVASR